MVEYFAKMDSHNTKMLYIWLEWNVEYDGDADFEEWLVEEIRLYELDDMSEWAEPYRQALAEWRA